MKKPGFFKLSALVSGLCMLGAASAAPAPKAAKKAMPAPISYAVTMPAYAVITDVLDEMIPLFNQQRNPDLMRIICYASGAGVNKSLRDILVEQNVNFKNVTVSPKGISLIQENNKDDLRNSCVSWIASTISDIVDTSAWMDNKKANEPKTNTDNKNPLKLREKSDNNSTQQINPNRFIENASEKLVIAQANAELYAYIVANLNADKALTMSQYKSEIEKLLNAYGERFFLKIHQTKTRNADNQFIGKVNGLNDFIISDPFGVTYEQVGSIPSLTIDGIDWLRNGKIMGKEYYLKVNVAEN